VVSSVNNGDSPPKRGLRKARTPKGEKMSVPAPWLKAMENGGLGEARAKAFLMDRFWVLERSVDIEGADYLVQRRLTSSNFLDRDPPRLGIVQVKFIQDGKTSISLHKSYVCDEKGGAYNEFFLLVFTGSEDHEKCYLLSAKQVIDIFTEVVDGDRILLRLRGEKLLQDSNYEVTQKGAALDRIEHALRNADFMSNRRFLGGTSYVKIKPEHIHEDYLKPLDNQYGDIQKVFFENKKKIQSVLFDIEAVVDAMHKILRETDPLIALKIYEDEIEQYVGSRNGLGFSSEFFDDEDFFDTVKNHRARLEKLRELGVEGSYFKLLEQYDSRVVQQLADIAFDSQAKTIRIKVTYHSETLRGPVVEVSVRDTDESTPYVATTNKGKQIIYYDLRTELSKFARTTSKNVEQRSELVRAQVWRVRRPFQAELDRLFLGESLVAF
jgi:hypothetical protein